MATQMMESGAGAETRLAPGQSRRMVHYLRAPGPISPYPATPQQPPLDPRMAALQRRLALMSKTGDVSQVERSITGKDSMGRPRPDNINQRTQNGYSSRSYPITR